MAERERRSTAIHLMAEGSRERQRERQKSLGTKYSVKVTPPIAYFVQMGSTS
jgi:hypothetical protein